MSASKGIDKKIASLQDWRGKELAGLRKAINVAEPKLKEEWKWGTPVWSYNGLVCSIGAFKDLFNAGLDAKETRAIDIHEGDKVNESALKDLVREAVRLNEKATYFYSVSDGQVR